MKRLRILFAIIMVLVLTTSFSYGETAQMEEGQISLDIPEGWEITTSDHYSEEMAEIYEWEDEEDAYESLQISDMVLMGHKEFLQEGTPYLSVMEIRYSLDEEGQEDYSTYTDSGLKEHGEEHIKGVIEDVVPSAIGAETVSWSEPELTKGSWEPFIHSRVNVGDDDHVNYYDLYYTVKGGVQISFLLTSYGDGLLDEQVQDAETMVKSFEDAGHYLSFAEDGGSYYDGDDGGYDDEYSDDYDPYSDEGDSWIEFLIPVIVLLVVGGFIAMEKSGGSGGMASLKKTLEIGKGKAKEALDLTQEKNRPVREKSAKPQIAKEASKVVKHQNQVPKKKAATPEQSYLNSLKTLLDSGLLTKEEYRDMIEKHNKRS